MTSEKYNEFLTMSRLCDTLYVTRNMDPYNLSKKIRSVLRKFTPGHCLKFKIVIGGREQVVHNNVRAAGSRGKS